MYEDQQKYSFTDCIQFKNVYIHGKNIAIPYTNMSV